MLHKDFLMRQIEGITTAIAELIFNKPSSRYEMQSEVRQLETDLLYVLLCKMLDEKNINGAENLLFETLDTNNSDYLAIASDFYKRINDFTAKELEEANFSRDEITDGMNAIQTIFGQSLK